MDAHARVDHMRGVGGAAGALCVLPAGKRQTGPWQWIALRKIRRRHGLLGAELLGTSQNCTVFYTPQLTSFSMRKKREKDISDLHPCTEVLYCIFSDF
jgi:hypothetical protein